MDSHLKKPSTNSVGNWTPDEDEIILRYVYEKGKSEEHMMWGNLSETLNGRSGKSCRERWFNHLDPKIKRTEWSQEEQWVLFILRNQTSEKWSLISKKLMGRTDNAVKNYWNSRLKKRIESMQHAVNQHFERKKKQKIASMTQSSTADQQATQDNSNPSGKPTGSTLPTSEQVQNLSSEQKIELEAYMERIKAEYLQKILEQVNNQNVEYFENLACEYTLQYQALLAKQQNNSLSADKPPNSNDDKQIEIAQQANQESAQTSKVTQNQGQAQQSTSVDGSKAQQFEQNDSQPSAPDAKQQNAFNKLTNGKQANQRDERMNQDEEQEADEGYGEQSQLPSFMKNPEVIKMHLDILYKSINFLSEEMIAVKIESYKQAKEQKKREEEERLQMQIQNKKNRGRSTTQQQNQNGNYQTQSAYESSTRKDRRSQFSGDRDCANLRQDGNGIHKNSQIHSKQYHSFMNCKNREYQNSTERYERASGVSTVNGLEMQNKAARDNNVCSKGMNSQSQHRYANFDRSGFNGRSECGKPRGYSKDYMDQHNGDCSMTGCHQGHFNHNNNCINNQKSHCLKIYGHNQSKLQKDGQIITQQKCGQKLTNQPRKLMVDANVHGHAGDDSFWSQSSFDSCSQISNNFNKQDAKHEVRSKKAHDQVMSPRSLKVKRMLKKLRKQKRQSNQIEKLFYSEKTQKVAVAIDPYLPNPISEDQQSVATNSKINRNQVQIATESKMKEQQDSRLSLQDQAKQNLALQQNGPGEPQSIQEQRVHSGSTKKCNSEKSAQQKQKQAPNQLKPKKSLIKKLNQKQLGQQSTAQKINDLKKLKLNNRVQQLKNQKLKLEAAKDPSSKQEVLNNQTNSQLPASGLFPMDTSILGSGLAFNQQPFGLGGFPFQAAQTGLDGKPDQFARMGFGNQQSLPGAPYQSLFGANGLNNGVFQAQNTFLPYGMAPNQFNTYQPGNGNTFFHQGCNIQYTDVKTYTTTIHLHCNAASDPKNGHSDFCKEAHMNAANPTSTAPQQTMHFTHTVPSHQFISQSNIPYGPSQGFTTNQVYNPLPMMFPSTSLQTDQAKGTSGDVDRGFKIKEGPNDTTDKVGDYQNDFMIQEHEIAAGQQRGNQMNNHSSSYHGSSKTNAKSHSKRYSMRRKRSMMQRGGHSYRTQNFLNQTMNQINKGHRREMHPLFNKKNTATNTNSNNKLVQPIAEYAKIGAAQTEAHQDRSGVISPEVIKRHKIIDESAMTAKQPTQNTPITYKNQTIYQSPGPTQSFARIHALYDQTPYATPVIGGIVAGSQSAFKPGIQTNQVAGAGFQTDQKKMTQNHDCLNMTGKASASTAATNMTAHQDKAMYGQPAESKVPCNQQNNEYSSDILTRVKSESHKQQGPVVSAFQF